MRKTLWRRELRADGWRYPGESGDGQPVLTLPELLQAAAEGRRRLALIVVQFEKSGDGRGFSQAQLLRQRLGYGAELRAGGVVKRDHLFLLARCGFDAFDLEPGEDLQAALAQLERYSVAYQAAADTLVQPRRREGFAT